MVRHLKWSRAQVHLAVSKMSPEHLCWAVAEHELTKDKRDTGGHEGPWAKDCRSACALAVQVLPRLRLSQPNSVLNLTKYRNGFFFSRTHWQVLFGPMYLEQGHSKLGSAFSQAPVPCILAAEQPPPSREVFSPHFMVRMISWDVGCRPKGPVSKEPPTFQAMGIKEKAGFRPLSVFVTNFQERVWGHDFPPAFLSEALGIGVRPDVLLRWLQDQNKDWSSVLLCTWATKWH